VEKNPGAEEKGSRTDIKMFGVSVFRISNTRVGENDGGVEMPPSFVLPMLISVVNAVIEILFSFVKHFVLKHLRSRMSCVHMYNYSSVADFHLILVKLQI
jgi:hypothetical protein